MTSINSHLKYFLVCVFSVCLANFPFWIFGAVFFINRPLFNFDTIIALIVYVFNKPIGLFLLVIAWLIDGLVSQSITYQFIAPINFLRSVRFSNDLDWLQFLTLWHIFGLFIFLSTLYILWFIYRYYSAYSSSVINLLVIGLVLVVSDIFNGASGLWRRDKMIVPINLAGSPGFGLVQSFLKTSETQEIKSINNSQSISKKFDITSWASANTDRSILFVIVESLGIPKSVNALDFLKQSTFSSNYKTNFYEIDFRGATTNGELRSLCSLEGSYTSISLAVTKDCLPSQLSKMGWRTIGFHGFSNRIFDRKSWWPLIGLNQKFFMENPEVARLNRCGNVFRGACDKDLLNLAISYITTPKSFAYILTLNTHLPVVNFQVPNNLTDICLKERLPMGACMHIAALKNLIFEIISSTSSMPASPLIVIVGDHAPPFSVISERDVFRQDVVPGFVLVPENSSISSSN